MFVFMARKPMMSSSPIKIVRMEHTILSRGLMMVASLDSKNKI